MKRIGLLFGMESEFPEALVNAINGKAPDISAQYVSLGAIAIDESPEYDVILDRISSKVPYYVSALKFAAINGVRVVNNPFVNCSADNFFLISAAKKLGVRLPRTAILPSKKHPPAITSDFLRNLRYPLNWDEIFEYIGWPAFIKPNSGKDDFNEYKVYNRSEFFSAYDLTGSGVMMLQECLSYDNYYRCFAIGKKDFLIMRYNPVKPLHMRYDKTPVAGNTPYYEEMRRAAEKICLAFDMDFNTIDFAIKGEEVIAVDFFNPAPVSEKAHLHPDNFEWLVDKTAGMLIENARKPPKEYVLGYPDPIK
jgi:glutathione synthase/RimK-type ligase-like ATP-grasp enzyme